ncbi:hypothetical protein [Actinacidiphila guanduensis]|uniref:Uncharacterized protein n=1 Tax=Actinacidiphila guanduensis TaxID=310781 RepID=A0A1H0LBU4_9ACTN|nr:hypothetical protein [Actinacidiphila guanduensis]SDO65658.1 hypothetical protein SAMN05216259_111155 [Actinacidiphila guanduensis]
MSRRSTSTVAGAFLWEVATAFDGAARELGLVGPAAEDRILMSATYTDGALDYEVLLDLWDLTVETQVRLREPGIVLVADIEPLVLAAGLVDRRGGISFSAASLYALRRSLRGHAAYVRKVQPVLAAGDAAALLRAAGAREYHPDPEN